VLSVALGACAVAPDSENRRETLNDQRILVAGGSGRAGRVVLRQLGAEPLTVRATTRSLSVANERPGMVTEGIEWVEADVRDPNDTRRALQDVDLVICVIGSRELSGPNSAEFVDYGGVKNLVDAAVEANVRHFVLLTAIGASDPQSFANKLFKGALEWRFKGEEHLRASGLAYTIVRPAGLTDEPGGAKGVRLYQGDDWRSHLRKTISREDLARVLIASLTAPGARNATFEIANEADEPVGTWPEQLAALQADGALTRP
jgi:uncharacterized protein YbjT (DUF2867 family)